MNCFFNLLFPKTCVICKRKGDYICNSCKKIFKHNLPECYLCRRVSGNYITHLACKGKSSLEWVYIAWEYNELSSRFIKEYKYKNVYDMQKAIADFFLDTLLRSSILPCLRDTLLIPIPISSLRKSERGFNQMEYISIYLANYLKLDINLDCLKSKSVLKHQASKNKLERLNTKNNFFFKQDIDIAKYKSITLIDDVITTGITLEQACNTIKARYGDGISINALCMYRGKPHY